MARSIRRTSWTGGAPVLFSCRQIVCGLLLAAALAPRADAQFAARTWLSWRTIDTEHFRIHTPVELEPWARHVAQRMEAIRHAVEEIVGYAPPQRVDVVVDDPFVVPNGFAFPLIDAPVMAFWATPPTPRMGLGNHQSWGEILAVHEFAHLAHLTRPSRNRFSRLLWQTLPGHLGPVTRKAPRWTTEGYATYVEGKLTGKGRPHAAWRAAYLRQWALEGRLPTYGQLSQWGAFDGGAFAYLAGSAYLEWLVDRRGDSSLVHLWRRMTARVDRSFDEAFAGVYGEGPQVLYQRFTVDVTARALDAARRLEAAGLDTGVMVQRLARGTGDPAISPEGGRVAAVVRTVGRPSRIVVWSTVPEPDTARERRAEELLRRDPEDVAPHHIFPPPRRPLATLLAVSGLPYEEPRFLTDGRILTWRRTMTGDGTLAPELYLWDPQNGNVRRVTTGGGFMSADPLPNGDEAVAVRCFAGRCGIARVDLETGAFTMLRHGSFDAPYYRPRVSPDGTHAVAAQQVGGRWRLVRIALDTGAEQVIDLGDGADRYDASFVTNTELVAVTESGGAPNVERIDLTANTSTPVTRVTGAAVAPVLNPADSSIWFLSLHSRGYDLRSMPPPATAADPYVVELPPGLAPAAPLVARDTPVFEVVPVARVRGYGLGPRVTRWMPGGSLGADGGNSFLAIHNVDVVGRLAVHAQGGWGDGAAWEGFQAGGAWRGTREVWRLQLFSASQRPSRGQVLPAQRRALDYLLRGGMVSAERDHRVEWLAASGRLGIASATLDPIDTAGSRLTRNMGFLIGALGARRHGDSWRLDTDLLAHLSHGRLGQPYFTRWLLTARVRMAGPFGASGAATLGRVTGNAPEFERFTLGGMTPAFVDPSLLSQRITMPALPTGTDSGSVVLTYRADVSFMGVSPYVWAGSTSPGRFAFDDWHRVVGVETTIAVPPVSFVGTPGARVLLGIGRSLDPPVERRMQGYVSVHFAP